MFACTSCVFAYFVHADVSELVFKGDNQVSKKSEFPSMHLEYVTFDTRIMVQDYNLGMSHSNNTRCSMTRWSHAL
jgi:hypothetical protein